MYNNSEAADSKNTSFNDQQLNRDKENPDDGEFSEKFYNMPYMTRKSHKCCMYYDPKMGCMYKHHHSMNEMDDPMMDGQYGYDDPMMDEQYGYDDPMMDGQNGYDDPPFFPRPFFHHIHHHFFHY